MKIGVSHLRQILQIVLVVAGANHARARAFACGKELVDGASHFVLGGVWIATNPQTLVEIRGAVHFFTRTLQPVAN